MVLQHRRAIDIYEKAAKALIKDGYAETDEFPDFASESGFKPPQTEFLYEITYDGRKPNAYLDKLAIGLKAADTL